MCIWSLIDTKHKVGDFKLFSISEPYIVLSLYVNMTEVGELCLFREWFYSNLFLFSEKYPRDILFLVSLKEIRFRNEKFGLKIS